MRDQVRHRLGIRLGINTVRDRVRDRLGIRVRDHAEGSEFSRLGITI